MSERNEHYIVGKIKGHETIHLWPAKNYIIIFSSYISDSSIYNLDYDMDVGIYH